MPLLAENKWVVTTIAGNGSGIFADGPAREAAFQLPWDVSIAPDGAIYVTDLFNFRIRKITAGHVSTIAGSRTPGIVNGPGSSASFKLPTRMAIDNDGNLYTLDSEDPRVRKISPQADVITYAGTSVFGYKDGVSNTAQFQSGIGGIAADAEGNIYITDTYNNRIRKIDRSGQVSTIAGNGIAGFKDGESETAQFNKPAGIVIDQNRNLFITDNGNYRVRKITPGGLVSTFAGSGKKGEMDGAAGIAKFDTPQDIVIDKEGNLFVLDKHRIRRISNQGSVTTIAGSTAGYADGDGSSAKFNYPSGLGIDAQSNIYIADTFNNLIRKISLEE